MLHSLNLFVENIAFKYNLSSKLIWLKIFNRVLKIIYGGFSFPEIFRKKKKNFLFPSKEKIISYIFENLKTWGAQGQMTRLNFIVNSLPRDLLEFVFFLAVGFTAGSVGII